MARCGSRHRMTPVDGAIIAAKLNNVTNPFQPRSTFCNSFQEGDWPNAFGVPPRLPLLTRLRPAHLRGRLANQAARSALPPPTPYLPSA